MQKLAQGTAERLAAQGIIREEDAPIYRYGLEAMYSSMYIKKIGGINLCVG